MQSWSHGSNSEGNIHRTYLHDNVWIRDGTLVLRQSGYSDQDMAEGKAVKVASISSNETDILYGSFRMVARMDVGDGGTCGGFFWYKVPSGPSFAVNMGIQRAVTDLSTG